MLKYVSFDIGTSAEAISNALCDLDEKGWKYVGHAEGNGVTSFVFAYVGEPEPNP